MKPFQGLGIPIDAKDLEKKIGTQLSDALLKLTTAEERLKYYQDLIENNDELDKTSGEIKSLLVKISRAFAKIDSATKHIENFYNLANGIPI